MMVQPIRVLLVDDNADFLAVLRRFLADYPRIAVIGSALSGREAIEQVSRLRPDLVLLDLVMPEMSGLEVLQRIRTLPTAPRVIILTFGNELVFRIVAEELGADGFVTKAEMSRRLLPLINGLFPSALKEPGRSSSDLPGEAVLKNRGNGES